MLLPQKFLQTMEEKIISIYFIDNFEGSGMTMEVYDKKGNMYIVLFLNPEIFRQNITEWINLRENTYFDYNQDFVISAECSKEYYALLFALLHEASHIYDYYYHITPFTEPKLKNKHSPEKTDFTNAVWIDHSKPFTEYDFPYRNELFAWGLGPAQNRTFAMDIYSSISKTPFASIYGSQNWAEDFAEAFTWYYLDKLLDCSYRVMVTNNAGTSKETFIYEPMKNPLLLKRVDFLAPISN